MNKPIFFVSLLFVILLSAVFVIPGIMPIKVAIKGLVFDIVGVLITFFRSLPSSGYEGGVCIRLEDETEIEDEDGRKMTVREFSELQKLRKKWHKYCSWLGLVCLCIGFVVQVIAAF